MRNFKLDEAIEILERTPKALDYFLTGLSDGWLTCREGENTWNVLEIIDHLIEGEKENWIVRLEFILQEGDTKPFPAFDRFSHLSKPDRPLTVKLKEFTSLREENIRNLKSLIEKDEVLEKCGYHPILGRATVSELISTWAVHDLTHLSQIIRVMAKRYQEDVGPWIAFLGVLNRK